MGIEQTKSILKTFYSTPPIGGDDYLQKAFNTECLQLDDFINFYWKDKASEHLGSTNISTKPPVITREKEKFSLKEEIIFNEIPNLKQNPTKAFNIESLAEFRNSYIPENTTKFSQMQMKRMNVLLFAYVKKILMNFNENSTIECISKYFDSLAKNKEKIDGNLGINLFIKLVSDISKGNVAIKEKNLDFMLENNKFIRPLSFYGETKEHFILDKALDKIIEYLKELISDPTEKDLNKMKALKIIFNLSLAKGSLKNLLDVINAVDKLPKKNIDFNYELNLFKNEFRKFGLGLPKSNNQKIESKIWNYSLKKEEDKSKSSKTFYSTTTDGKYLYFFSSTGVLLKIGTGYNKTMLGKVYLKKENYRTGERATLCYVEGILYYRSNQLDSYPIISINPENFEEIQNKYIVDYSEINHIFPEEKRSEFEFPHSSYEDMMEIIERKKIMGLEDKSNVRPTDASPMLTEGRYIYIISKWYDEENDFEKKDEEDDGDINTNSNNNNKNKQSLAIFGVNIYDPLNNMCHVRSIQLIPQLSNEEDKIEDENNNNNSNNKTSNNMEENRNNRNYGSGNPFYNSTSMRNISLEEMINDRLNNNREKKSLQRDFLQGQNHFYTNGAILYINQYKFSLVTGHLLGDCNLNSRESNSYCYDLKNNLIWCVYIDAINNIKIISYFNESAKLIHEYPKGHPKYNPCSVEKIIEICEKNISLSNLKEDVTNNKYKRQETLDLLCLEDEQTKEYKEIKISNDVIQIDNYENYKLNLQCLILNTIAKVSEFYGQVPDLKIASNDVDRGKILAQAMRRPFCVKLEPKIFSELINLLMTYSSNFIKGNYTDIEAYCLLAIVKIIRTNLKCLSISNLGIDYFIGKNTPNDKNPFSQMKEFIFNIIKKYHDKNDIKNDLFKAVYDECKIILQVSVNTLYQKNSDIIHVLCDSLNDYVKNEYSQDVILCILTWMSNEDNIHKIFQNSDETCMNLIFDILQKVSVLEVDSIKKFLDKNKTNVDNFEKESFRNSELEKVSFEFISSLQLELIKHLSKKLLNDQYDNDYYEKLVHKFTEILFNNLTLIFFNIKNFIQSFLKQIEKKYNEKYCPADDEEEEDMICTSNVNKNYDDDEDNIITTTKTEKKTTPQKDIPKLEDYKKEIMNKLYKTFILNLIMNNTLHIKSLTFHINSLSILSSDYILSAYILKDFVPLLKQMNDIYSLIMNNCSFKAEEVFVKNEEYKEIFIESDHPYVSGTQKEYNLEIPGQKAPLYIEFDEKCQICPSPDQITGNAIYFYKDKKQRGENYFPEYPKISGVFPKKTLELKTLPCYLIFNAYSKNPQNCYGFKLKLHNGKDVNVKKEVSDALFDLIRIVNWVGCKCISVIIKGNFLKLSQDNSENEKYNEILSSNLFLGGINYKELLNEKENIIQNIVKIFDNYEKNLELYKNLNNNQENILLNNEINLFQDEKCKETLKIFQKQLLTKNPAANVGGEQGFKVVTACFLALIHHTNEMNIFLNEIIGKSEQEILKLSSFENLFKKYALASQMRSWLVEKKKNIAESIEKQNVENESNYENNKGEEKAENYMNKIVNQAVNKAKFLIKIHASNINLSEKNSNDLCNLIISTLKGNLSNKKLQRNLKIYTLRAIGRQIGLDTFIEIFKSISDGIILQDLLSWFNSSLRCGNNNSSSEGTQYNNFNYYLDNIPGCGIIIKNNIQKSFQYFLSLLMQKYLKNSNEKELNSFLDTLIWKYSTDDHQFLIEKSMFNILWGLENETIKNAWGKSYLLPQSDTKKKERSLDNQKHLFSSSYNPFLYGESSLFGSSHSFAASQIVKGCKNFAQEIPEKSNKTLTNEVIEVFEILSSICLNSTINYSNNYNNEESLSFTQILIQNIINIIFGEIAKATNNYLEYRGISKRLLKQYELFVEEGNNKEMKAKKEKDKKINEMIEQIRQQRMEELDNGELDFDDDESPNSDYDSEERERNFIDRGIDREAIERQISDLEKKKVEKEEEGKEKKDGEDFYFTQLDIENLYDNIMKISQSKKEKKIYITSDELFNIISGQWTVIYSPKFLNRLLQILYKISIQNIDIILKCVQSSDYIYSLIKLMKYCSTPEKILSIKIINNLSVNISEENLNEICELYLNDYGIQYQNFIELLVDNAMKIRKATWNSGEYNSQGNYIISNYIIKTIRDLAYNDKFSKEINTLINEKNLSEIKSTEDFIKKEIIFGIVGGDFFGQANGSRVQVPNSLFGQNNSFDFNKKDYEEQPNYGTIIGFSTTMNEYFGVTESNSKKLDEITNNSSSWNPNIIRNNNNQDNFKDFEPINVTPNNNMENKVGVLLDSSLSNMDSFNIRELSPKVFMQCKAMPLVNSINFDKFIIENDTIDFLVDFLDNNIKINSNEKKINSNIANLCNNIIRFLFAYFDYYSNSNEKIGNKINQKLIKFILDYSVVPIDHGQNFINLEFNEEKLYRLSNYCNENKESLDEIPQISIIFSSMTNYLIRLFNGEDKNMSLCNTIINIENKNNFSLILDNEYHLFYQYNDTDTLIKNISAHRQKNFVLITDNSDNNLEDIFKTIRNNKTKNYRITNYIVLGSKVDRSLKKDDCICYVQIYENELSEINEIVNELTNNKDNPDYEYQNELLKMLFKNDKNKNEKEKLIDELINDYGFNKENIETILKEFPAMDFNEIINKLLEMNKPQETKTQFEIDFIQKQQQIQNNNQMISNLMSRNMIMLNNNDNNIVMDPIIFNGPINSFMPSAFDMMNVNMNNNINNERHNYEKERENMSEVDKKIKEKEKEKDPIQKKIEDEKKLEEKKEKKSKKRSKKNRNMEDNNNNNPLLNRNKFEEDEEDDKSENEEDSKSNEDKKSENDEEDSKHAGTETPMENSNKEQQEIIINQKELKNEEILEKEAKNDCFGFDKEKNINMQEDFEKELFIDSNSDKSNLFLIFKNIGQKIKIFYCRRIILSLFKLSLKNENNSEILNTLLDDSISKEEIYKTLKLLVHEGLFINSLNLGAQLLLTIKNIILTLNNSENEKCANLLNYILNKCLEEISFANDSESYEYPTLYNNEKDIIEKPFIFFDVWILLLLNNIDNKTNRDYYKIFNSLSGLIPKIKENKEIRWFILGALINYCLNIINILNSNKGDKFLEEMQKIGITKLGLIPNILKLEFYLKQNISNEGENNLSKRSQMICEILIYISCIDKIMENMLKKINKTSEGDNKIDKLYLKKLNKNDLKYKELYDKDNCGELQNFISELLSTSSIMKNFFEMNYIKYLAWTEMNPDILNESEINFESNHLYSKVPMTYLLEYPNVNNFEIKMDNISYFDEGDCLLFSTDKKGKNPLKCVINEDITENNKFKLKSPFVYVTFPGIYISKLYAFGINTFGKLGISQSIRELSIPKLISQLVNYRIVHISIGDTTTLLLTDDGEILTAGYGVSGGIDTSSEKFKVPEKFRTSKCLSNEKISYLATYGQSTIICTPDGSLWSIGNNTCSVIGQDFASNISELKTMQFKLKSPVTSLSIGPNHSLITTKDGKLFHIGSNDRYQNGENTMTRSNIPKEVSIKKNDFYVMASAGEGFSAFIIKDKITGKKKLYTAGWSKDGRSGIDEKGDSHPLHLFEDPKNKKREFNYVSTSESTGAAISTDGKLYTWGSNSKGECGHGSYSVINVPTLVKFFDKDYFVKDVCCISQATIVIAENKNNKQCSLFAMGENTSSRLGMTFPGNYEIKDTYPIPYKNPFFDGKNPEKIYGGSKGVIVKCLVEKIEELRDNFEVICDNCKNNVYDSLIYDINDNKLLCKNCSDDNKNENIVFKAKLKRNVYEKLNEIFKDFKKFQKEENEEDLICEGCNQKIILTEDEKYYYSYILNSNVKSNHKVNKNLSLTNTQSQNSLSSNKQNIKKYLCSYCIDHYPPCLNNIKVFYRSNNLKETICLEELEKYCNEEKYYETSNGYGYKFSLAMTFNDIGCEQIINKHKKEFDSFTKELKEVNRYEIYEQFVDYLNEMSQKANKSIFSYYAKDLTFKKENISIRNELINCPSETLKKMFVLLKILNTRVKELLPYIDFSKSLSDSGRLSDLFMSISPLIFWDTKNEMIQYYLDKTSYCCSVHELKINRFKVKKFIEKGKPDILGEHTVFGQIFQFLRTYPFKIFRKKKPDSKNINSERNSKLFNASFLGEASIDAGGPYRECLTSAYSELQSSSLSLFIPTPNQKNDSGSFREKWTVNPGAVSSTELEMYKIFGGLMGYAIRTGEFFNMDLCSIFWKSILEIPCDRKDLEKFDKYCVQFLDNIERINDEDSFVLFTDYKFKILLSNNSECLLCENGDNISLSLENKKKYIELVEKTRLNEGKLQIQAIRSGLEQVIPIGLLKLLSCNELETLVCGKPILDVELLKENTIYSGCSENDPLIKYFWRCLEEFSAEERASYLRFVWGRSRLPLTSKDFPMQHRISIMSHGNPDVALPTSHTCFFSVDIPRYTSYDILKAKFKYAITHCQAIDTDGAPREIWDDED